MLCSVCKKNTAVIFINKQGQDNKVEIEGLCYNCAKEKGLNPIDSLAKQANLSEKDIQNLTQGIDNLFANLAINMEGIDEEQLTEMMNEENNDDEEKPKGIPLGSIFSGLFGANQQGQDANNEFSGGRQKVKEKTKTNKKRRTLETYGTNLTIKAKNNQIDKVIGRDKEIERMIQIFFSKTEKSNSMKCKKVSMMRN